MKTRNTESRKSLPNFGAIEISKVQRRSFKC